MLRIQQARRILFIRTDRLGETLLTLPALAALREALPRASLTVLAHPDVQPLLARLPTLDQVIPYHPSPGRAWWQRARSLARALKALRPDVAIVSNPKKEFHLAIWLARIPCRVGYGRKWGCLLSHRLPDRKWLGERHEVDYNLDVVRALGLPAAIPPWQLPRFEREDGEVARLLSRQGLEATEPFLAVHPWSSNPDKQWPADRFRLLMARVADQLGCAVVVIGGSADCAQAAAVIPAHARVGNLVGRLTLPQLAALLRRAKTLVANDSGPMHLAAAVGTRTVALFGTRDAATGPRRWGPWGTGHCLIWQPSMDAITLDEVFAAVQRQMA